MQQNTHAASPARHSDELRIAVLGAGKLGGILLEAFLDEGLTTRDRVTATVAHRQRAESLAAKWQISVSTNSLEAAHGADIVLLAVKPNQALQLVGEIRGVLSPATLLISVVASVKTAAIEAAADISLPVVRAMPNTPAAVREGVTALSAGRFCSPAHLEQAERLFRTVGRTVVVDEKHMDAVTGLSGSGPAFLYIIIEALAEAGVNVGLPREVATMLAAQTTLGSAKMVLETGSHPALLKDAVTTPAGCTVDGILELEEGGLRVTLIKAVKRATVRARELAAGE